MQKPWRQQHVPTRLGTGFSAKKIKGKSWGLANQLSGTAAHGANENTLRVKNRYYQHQNDYFKTGAPAVNPP